MTVTAELAQRQEEILERIKSLELTVGSSASSSIPSGADARVKDLAVRQIRIIARLAAIELQLGVGIGAATGEEHASLEEDVPCAPPEIFDDQDPALTERLHTELLSRNVMKHRLTWVPSFYYEKPLEWRKEVLNAFSVDHLCKTIVMENTRAHKDVKGYEDRNNSKYYAVVVQYTARLSADKLAYLIYNDLNKRKTPKKYFNMRLVAEETSEELTGYKKGGVTPAGMRHRIPIVISHCIGQLSPNFFFMGGGHLDLKLGVDFEQFVSAYDVIVADITYDEGSSTIEEE